MTISSSGSSNAAPPPPKLVFDDGSRVMRQEQAAPANNNEDAPTTCSRPRHCPVREYYEVDRLVQEILSQPPQNDNGYRIALQFPDELLSDAPDVCWEFERQLAATNANNTALVFVLGDTTYAPCCPDLVAAAHLQASVLVHYGHACLSSSTESSSCRVLYSWGRRRGDVAACVRVVTARCSSQEVERLLLLYEVSYHHCVAELQAALLAASSTTRLEVVVGSLPSWAVSSSSAGAVGTAVPSSSTVSGCCSETNNECGSSSATSKSDGCHHTSIRQSDITTSSTAASNQATSNSSMGETGVQDPNQSKPPILQPHPITVGGLELPTQVVSHGTDGWSAETGTGYTVLFLGRDTSPPFFNMVLRFLSSNHHRPDQFWTWSPETGLSPSSWLSSPSFQRTLNRRFYLVQKARQCRVFGILVAHMTNDTRRLVASLRQTIARHCPEATSYTLVVGKINPAKLTNFPEIDCFVLVACPEHSLLSDHDQRERYPPIPIVTPLELLMALGVTEWGAGAGEYTTHPADYWRVMGDFAVKTKKENDKGNDCDDDDSDAPYFSLVTGKYEASQTAQTDDAVDLAALPGRGALTSYRSAAADFLQQREYQGLTVVGAADDEDGDKVHAAVPGHTGIASNYNNR